MRSVIAPVPDSIFIVTPSDVNSVTGIPSYRVDQDRTPIFVCGQYLLPAVLPSLYLAGHLWTTTGSRREKAFMFFLKENFPVMNRVL